MKKMARNNLTLDDYVGYTDTKENINTYKEEVELKFNSLRGELQ